MKPRAMTKDGQDEVNSFISALVAPECLGVSGQQA